MKIYSVHDKEFRDYGTVVENFPCEEILKVLGKKTCPEDSVLYVPSDEELEGLEDSKKMFKTMCGSVPMQMGYTNGHCRKMNALEYHKSSEWNVSTEDIILFLGLRTDLDENYTMDTSKVKAFLLPAGTLVEVFATTLHYAPCQTNENGYRCIVVLPKGTNLTYNIDVNAKGEDRLLAATNKWLVGHPEGGCQEGTFIGLTGVNLEV